MAWQDSVKSVLNASKSVFGEAITYTPADPLNPPFQIKGIFSKSYVEIGNPNGGQTISFKPVLGISLFDFAVPPKKGDKVTVRGVDYSIIESREDGEGGTTLILHIA